jgi:hypothetical protein
MRNRNWDEDRVGGGPSSIEVLLEWLEMDGNAARWQRSAGKGKGARIGMVDEVLDLLLSYGINHRTAGGISARLYLLEHQLEQADVWLQSRGLRNYDVSRKTEDAVLRICPYYPELKPLFRSMRPAPVAKQVEPSVRRRSHSAVSEAESTRGFEYPSSSDDDEMPKGGTARGGVGGPHALPEAKRARVEDKLEKVKLEDTKCVAILEAEPDERREFFRLELQVKRDEAILVRAKARKELLDMGVAAADVDRLLPL